MNTLVWLKKNDVAVSVSEFGWKYSVVYRRSDGDKTIACANHKSPKSVSYSSHRKRGNAFNWCENHHAAIAETVKKGSFLITEGL